MNPHHVTLLMLNTSINHHCKNVNKYLGIHQVQERHLDPCCRDFLAIRAGQEDQGLLLSLGYPSDLKFSTEHLIHCMTILINTVNRILSMKKAH